MIIYNERGEGGNGQSVLRTWMENLKNLRFHYHKTTAKTSRDHRIEGLRNSPRRGSHVVVVIVVVSNRLTESAVTRINTVRNV